MLLYQRTQGGSSAKLQSEFSKDPLFHITVIFLGEGSAIRIINVLETCHGETTPLVIMAHALPTIAS